LAALAMFYFIYFYSFYCILIYFLPFTQPDNLFIGFYDKGNFDAITYRINGGYNGKADRDKYYQKALKVLGG